MNSTRPSSDTPIAEFLREIAHLDIRDDYVAPKDDVSKRLETEIQRKCNCIPSLLIAEYATGKAKRMDRKFISADPSTFADDTLAEIDRISSNLKQIGAKQFEVAFHNTPCEPNEWGDQIVFVVRYVS
jgi:hypothetical protein